MAQLQDELGNAKFPQTYTEKVYDKNGDPINDRLPFITEYNGATVEPASPFVHEADIVNNLTTNDPTKPLSAAQGYALNSNLTIKSKTFNVNTGGVSQVTFEMDDTEQIPIHVKSASNDIFSLAERTGIRWKFSVGRLTLETSVHNGYFYEALFNKDITITVYYIC